MGRIGIVRRALSFGRRLIRGAISGIKGLGSFGLQMLSKFGKFAPLLGMAIPGLGLASLLGNFGGLSGVFGGLTGGGSLFGMGGQMSSIMGNCFGGFNPLSLVSDLGSRRQQASAGPATAQAQCYAPPQVNLALYANAFGQGYMI